MTCTAVAPELWSSAASTYGTQGTLRPRGRLERATQVAAFLAHDLECSSPVR
jgi:hypothetical protein